MQFVQAADADVTGQPKPGSVPLLSGRLLRMHRHGWNPYFTPVCVWQGPVLCPTGLRIAPIYRHGHVQTVQSIKQLFLASLSEGNLNSLFDLGWKKCIGCEILNYYNCFLHSGNWLNDKDRIETTVIDLYLCQKVLSLSGRNKDHHYHWSQRTLRPNIDTRTSWMAAAGCIYRVLWDLWMNSKKGERQLCKCVSVFECISGVLGVCVSF